MVCSPKAPVPEARSTLKFDMVENAMSGYSLAGESRSQAIETAALEMEVNLRPAIADRGEMVEPSTKKEPSVPPSVL